MAIASAFLFYAEATASEIVLLFRLLFSDCALWRYEGFSVAAPFWRYYACSQCGWLMGRVSVHRQFQFNTRRSAGKEKVLNLTHSFGIFESVN